MFMQKSSNRWLGACAVLAFVGACGNGGDVLPTPDYGSGAIAIALTGAANVAGFQIDVANAAGTIVASQFVSASAGAAAEAFFTVAPGEYTVTSTPDSAPGVPEPSCSPSSG